MPEVARKGGTDSVASPDGSGDKCKSPSTSATDVGSDNVFVESVGVVREGDTMASHNGPECTPHAPALSTFSGTVYANGKKIGRKGDSYSDHTITSGSSKVIAGG
jgi:uncharacterized Zn-binding protein involved in type VI secretion